MVFSIGLNDTFTCRKCNEIMGKRYTPHLEIPKHISIYCPNPECDPNKNYLGCQGVRKDGSKCRLDLEKIHKQSKRSFYNGVYCFLHIPMQKTMCWMIALSDGSEGGIFTSLEKAETFTEDLQRTYDKLITSKIGIGYREEYNLTKYLSSLKVIDLIDLINDFIDKNQVWIVNEPTAIVDFDYDGHKYLVTLNESFKNDSL